MAVDWTESFICSKCNTSRQVVNQLEQGTDPDTKNPFTIIEMDCGHTEKRQRVTKPLSLHYQISKGENLRVEPVIDDGTPSVAVSGGSQTTVVVGGAVNIGLEEVKNSIVNVIVTNANTEGNSNFVQNLSETQVNITYNEILKEIDRDITDESERQEIKNILEEIKNDIKSKQIPVSGLQKLKKYEKIYNVIYPWAMKGIDFVLKNGFFNQ